MTEDFRKLTTKAIVGAPTVEDALSLWIAAQSTTAPPLDWQVIGMALGKGRIPAFLALLRARGNEPLPSETQGLVLSAWLEEDLAASKEKDHRLVELALEYGALSAEAELDGLRPLARMLDHKRLDCAQAFFERTEVTPEDLTQSLLICVQLRAEGYRSGAKIEPERIDSWCEQLIEAGADPEGILDIHRETQKPTSASAVVLDHAGAWKQMGGHIAKRIIQQPLKRWTQNLGEGRSHLLRWLTGKGSIPFALEQASGIMEQSVLGLVTGRIAMEEVRVWCERPTEKTGLLDCLIHAWKNEAQWPCLTLSLFEDILFSIARDSIQQRMTYGVPHDPDPDSIQLWWHERAPMLIALLETSDQQTGGGLITQTGDASMTAFEVENMGARKIRLDSELERISLERSTRGAGSGAHRATRL